MTFSLEGTAFTEVPVSIISDQVSVLLRGLSQLSVEDKVVSYLVKQLPADPPGTFTAKLTTLSGRIQTSKTRISDGARTVITNDFWPPASVAFRASLNTATGILLQSGLTKIDYEDS